MSKPQITIYKKAQRVEPTKSACLYLSTHEKITNFQMETGLSIPQLLAICVDFTLEHAIISSDYAADYKVEELEDK